MKKMQCQTGLALQVSSVNVQRANRFNALLEIRRLGKNPKPVSYGAWVSRLRHIAEGTNKLHRWYVLIDYRNGSKVLLPKRPLTTREAYLKNQFLAGTGKAWAKVG